MASHHSSNFYQRVNKHSDICQAVTSSCLLVNSCSMCCCVQARRRRGRGAAQNVSRLALNRSLWQSSRAHMSSRRMRRCSFAAAVAAAAMVTAAAALQACQYKRPASGRCTLTTRRCLGCPTSRCFAKRALCIASKAWPECRNHKTSVASTCRLLTGVFVTSMALSGSCR